MSFNLRVVTKNDGENDFVFRRERIKRLIEQEAPDVIGFQEAVPYSREWLRSTLFEHYDLIGCGRDNQCVGEGIAIAYRRDRLSLISLNTFWLSETPDLPGSVLLNCDQSNCPRVAQIVVFKPVGVSGFFRFINTHLDHKGAVARGRELAQLEPYLLSVDLPSVLTGDFNALPADPEIAAFSERIGAHGWSDASAHTGGTFHGYGRCCPPSKIDYIFANCPFRESRVLDTVPENGVFDSDHYALMTTVSI